jgi:hypothetical protein
MKSHEMVFCKTSRAGKGIRFRNRHIEVRPPDCQLVDPEVEIGKRLRPCPQIFPFCEDWRAAVVIELALLWQIFIIDRRNRIPESDFQ